DFHELKEEANGNLMLLSSPLTSNVPMPILGADATATIVDCLLQEIDSAGNLLWQWRASEHISTSQSTHPLTNRVGDHYDVFHCNSIDTDAGSGNVLLSARHTDAVYLIDKTTGNISWKLGGNAIS